MLELLKSHIEQAHQLGLIPLVAVIGPTASGKTSFGIALARALHGEIVSADSRQIYQEMDIGTALPTPEERLAARHHLIDFLKPDQPFTLADYQQLANQTIRQIFQANKQPILVGGTGLYINAVAKNYLLPDSQPNQALRAELTQLAIQQGNQVVYERLKSINPVVASTIHPNNLRYVIRAIEITSSASEQPAQGNSPYHTFYLSIDWPRAELYQRIEKRIDLQIEQGMIEETAKLLGKYPASLPALSSLGYAEIGQYLTGEISLQQALQEFKLNTRHYAKRQLTWFRKIKPVYLIPGDQLADLSKQLGL